MIAYLSTTSRLSRHLGVPSVPTLGRMLLGRLRFKRGPKDFDTFQFANKPVSQWQHYFRDDERYRLQSSVTPVAERALEENKLLFWQRCIANSIPCAAINGVIPNARAPLDVASISGAPVFATETSLMAFFASVGHLDGFAKPIGGGQGYGAFAFAVRDGSLVPSARHRTVADLFAECANSRFPGGGYLLQPRLVVHESMLPFMPGPGVGTVRVFSFLGPNGSVEIPFAGLRVPAPGAVCDNFKYGALGVPIDISTGRMGRAVGATAAVPVSHFMDTHPETGATFVDAQLPHWNDVLALVRTAARVFHRLPALGWDVAICANGPVVLEANWEFGADFAERLTNRGWAAELRQWYSRYPKWA